MSPPSAVISPTVAAPRQPTLAEAGTPLREVTFVVVDLETTGGAPGADSITEIGAVKIRAGAQLGEFATLVDPQVPIPAFVSTLTGITAATVRGAPPLSAALPMFLEWARGSVLVAHNAPFDVGFLRAGCERHGLDWPGFRVLDTARLARQALTREEAPNCKLATLANLFGVREPPTHRALADARATVGVLHGLFERLGGLGVTTLEEAAAFSSRVSPAQRRKRGLADGLPQAPGVYLFRDATGRVLYAGKSRNVAARVRQYFGPAEPRRRMREMVALAECVDALGCPTELEASVRELRLIGEHKPPFNRRSRYPERANYLVLTAEPFPRLAVVRRTPRAGEGWIGPFGSTGAAELARQALYGAFPVRRCPGRLSRRGTGRRCALAELGRCPAPCDGGIDLPGYARITDGVASCLAGDPAQVLASARERLAALCQDERYEEAAMVRDGLAAFLRGAARAQSHTQLVAVGRLLAARPAAGAGSHPTGWELALIERGRLLGTAYVPPGVAPRGHLEALVAAAPVAPPSEPGWPPGAAADAAELDLVGSWLSGPGTRLVSVGSPFTSPVGCAARHRGLIAELSVARQDRPAPGSNAP